MSDSDAAERFALLDGLLGPSPGDREALRKLGAQMRERNKQRDSEPRNHGFGPHAEMAFYDKDKNRVTPWMPLDGAYIGENHTHGIACCWAGVRDFEEFEWFTLAFTLVAGSRHTAVLPQVQPYRRSQ